MKSNITTMLDRSLATEIICTLRYMENYHAAEGILGKVAAEEFLEHAKQEQEHADKIAERLSQLGERPNFNPESLAGRSFVPFVSSDNLFDMLRENLVAERSAIDIYRRSIREIGEEDPTTRRLFEKILADEEEHADDVMKLLKGLKREDFQKKRFQETAA